MDEEETKAPALASGFTPSDAVTAKDEPQTRADQVKSEAPIPKLELPTLDVKEEVNESEAKEQFPDILPEEVPTSRETPPHDSEDSLSPGCVADELKRLAEVQAQSTSNVPHQSSEEGATASTSTWNRTEAVAPDSSWDWESRGPYAPQRSERHRGGTRSPDPFMFNTTVWINHDSEASARAHEDPINQLRDRVHAMEHNLETLRTRLTHFANLRDAQGIREDQRAIVARLNDLEECASVHTLREFMSKILRLETMLSR